MLEHLGKLQGGKSGRDCMEQVTSSFLSGNSLLRDDRSEKAGGVGCLHGIYLKIFCVWKQQEVGILRDNEGVRATFQKY